MAAIFILLIIPMLLIAKYNVISCDDFSYGYSAHNAWKNTHSLANVMESVIRGTKWSYMNWQGTITAVFLMRMQPGIFNENMYVLSTWIMLSALIAGVCFFCYVLFHKVLKASKAQTLIIASLWLILNTQLLLSALEGFYWYNGSLYYTFFYAVSLILYAMALIVIKREKQNILLVIIGAFLSAFIGGGNFVTALISELLLLLALIYSIRGKNRGKIVVIAIWLVCLTAVFLLSVKAPGNAVRQAEFTHTPNPVRAIVMSILFSSRMIFMSPTTPVPYLILALAPVLYKIAEKSSLSFRYPLLVFAFSFLLFSAQDVPPWYAMNYCGDPRLVNIIYYSMIFLLMFDLFYLLGYITKRTKFDMGKYISKRNTAIFCSVLIIFAAAIHILNSASVSTDEYAVKSLISGEAERYHEEYEERLNVIANSGDSVVLKEYSVKPHILFCGDAGEDPKHWVNIDMADWYNKEEIIVLPR